MRFHLEGRPIENGERLELHLGMNTWVPAGFHWDGGLDDCPQFVLTLPSGASRLHTTVQLDVDEPHFRWPLPGRMSKRRDSTGATIQCERGPSFRPDADGETLVLGGRRLKAGERVYVRVGAKWHLGTLQLAGLKPRVWIEELGHLY